MKKSKAMLIDAVGAIIVASLVGAVAWYVFIKPDTASSQVQVLLTEVSQRRADLAGLRTLMATQRTRYRDLSAEAASLGQLPSKSPIDQDLKKIAALAGENNIQLLDVTPASRLQYPDVLELQYNIKTEGTYADHVRFLEAFEVCSFWADVTYLRFAQAPTAFQTSAQSRRGELTVSFYSAMQ